MSDIKEQLLVFLRERTVVEAVVSPSVYVKSTAIPREDKLEIVLHRQSTPYNSKHFIDVMIEVPLEIKKKKKNYEIIKSWPMCKLNEYSDSSMLLVKRED